MWKPSYLPHETDNYQSCQEYPDCGDNPANWVKGQVAQAFNDGVVSVFQRLYLVHNAADLLPVLSESYFRLLIPAFSSEATSLGIPWLYRALTGITGTFKIFSRAAVSIVIP